MSPRRRAILVAAGAALVAAVAGGTATQVGPWYQGLDKSPGTPPDWVFGPAWTLIYATTVVAAVECWQRIHTFRERAWLLSLYFCNAVLNVLWSSFFFAWRRPDWALAEVVVLWLSIAALIAFSWPRSRRAGLLLTPYLVWVAFAGYLNWVVVVRNGPFDA